MWQTTIISLTYCLIKSKCPFYRMLTKNTPLATRFVTTVLPVAGVGVLETEISTDDDVIESIDISLVDVVNTLKECIVVSVLEVDKIPSPDVSVL